MAGEHSPWGEFVWKIEEDGELPLDHALGFDVRPPESMSVHGEVVRLDAMYERYDIIDEFLFIGDWMLDARAVVMYEVFGVRHIYYRRSRRLYSFRIRHRLTISNLMSASSE